MIIFLKLISAQLIGDVVFKNKWQETLKTKWLFVCLVHSGIVASVFFFVFPFVWVWFYIFITHTLIDYFITRRWLLKLAKKQHLYIDTILHLITLLLMIPLLRG